MSADQIDYQRLTGDALRDVVRRVLVLAAEEGLPGEHHFFLTFDTTHPGVELSRQVRNLYPEEMTIVLQHQFWDLTVDEEAFGVTLLFGGSKQTVLVPFEALRTFVDPAAEFGLNLDLVDQLSEEIEATDDGELATADQASSNGSDPDLETGGEVVSIDRFRKKPS
jgi:hypothetical protein